MANEILVDALPYFDVGFDELGVREMVNSAKIIIVSESFKSKQKCF